MRPVASLAGALVVLGVSSVYAQSMSRFNSPLPLWADSALLQSGFWQRYQLSSRLNPELAAADLDGDGLWDVALAVVDRATRRRGVAIIHQIDRSVRIVGAGESVGNAKEVQRWGITPLLGHRSAISVEQWDARGWFVWNGQSYVWLPAAASRSRLTGG